MYDSNTSPHHHLYEVDTGEVADVPLSQVQVQSLEDALAGLTLAGVDVIARVRGLGGRAGREPAQEIVRPRRGCSAHAFAACKQHSAQLHSFGSTLVIGRASRSTGPSPYRRTHAALWAAMAPAVPSDMGG